MLFIVHPVNISQGKVLPHSLPQPNTSTSFTSSRPPEGGVCLSSSCREMYLTQGRNNIS